MSDTDAAVERLRMDARLAINKAAADFMALQGLLDGLDALRDAPLANDPRMYSLMVQGPQAAANGVVDEMARHLREAIRIMGTVPEGLEEQRND